jgi:hypothetical protein
MSQIVHSALGTFVPSEKGGWETRFRNIRLWVESPAHLAGLEGLGRDPDAWLARIRELAGAAFADDPPWRGRTEPEIGAGLRIERIHSRGAQKREVSVHFTDGAPPHTEAMLYLDVNGELLFSNFIPARDPQPPPTPLTVPGLGAGEVRGDTYAFRIDVDGAAVTLLLVEIEERPKPRIAAARKQIPKLGPLVRRARQRAASDLLGVYNDEWRADGVPVLTAAELEARLCPAEIALYADRQVEIRLVAEGDLFSGHDVEVSVAPGGRIESIEL